MYGHSFSMTMLASTSQMLYPKKTSRLWVGRVTSCTLQSRHEFTILRLILKIKIIYTWETFIFSLEELPSNSTRAIQHMYKSDVLDGIIMLPKRWDSVIEKQGDYIEGLWTDNLKEIEVLLKKKYCVLFFKWPPYYYRILRTIIHTLIFKQFLKKLHFHHFYY